VLKVRGLLVRYLVASGTFYSGVVAMEAIILGSSFLGNFQLGFFFFLIKCKKYIDQKEQDKLAIQAGNQQNCTYTGKGNRLP